MTNCRRAALFKARAVVPPIATTRDRERSDEIPDTGRCLFPVTK